MAVLGCDGSGVTRVKDLGPLDGSTVLLDGTVRTGQDLATGCAELYYLEDESGFVQINSDTQEGVDVIVQSAQKKVRVEGEYRGPSLCEAVCACGDYVLVEIITVLE